jgi:stage V sporulation protein D (sporulation-specific penicillin-binding protein)
MVFTEAQTTRFYPEGTMLAHALGFVGSDNQGLFGLEYYYNDLLSGEDGYYAYAKDASGNTLDIEYSTYVDAVDGYSLVTTIDSYIQGELEDIIETVRINHGVENRVCGIVMDTKTGAILGMATSTPFDPNDPFTLDSLSQQRLDTSGFAKGCDEYRAYKNELLQVMWSNKAVSQTYEPGSTFKIVTVIAALDTNSAKLSDTFSCNGYCQVGGYRIRCHKVGGHGSGFSLAYGLQMSCNPCMIAISERTGAETFYSYVEKFGYFEKSGIDLPGEGTTIFHKPENIGSTELATASFGQRFKVSVINQLVAISSVSNGGKLVRPYIVDKVIDSSGKIISEHKTEIRNQVISPEVADTVSKILIDGVNGDGGAKNAGVIGYDIAAKTGTSQKFDILDENGNSYLRIGSTVAYAQSGDGGVSMIIVVDEPTSQVKYGSVVAAPYVSMLYERILPYLNFKSSQEIINTKVESYIGLSVEEAEDKLKKSRLTYEIIGDGNKVIKQTPTAGDILTYPLSKILLYTDHTDDERVTVPNVIGMNLPDAIRNLLDAGLNVRISGNGAIAPSAYDRVLTQSISEGTVVTRGEIITIRAIKEDYED